MRKLLLSLTTMLIALSGVFSAFASQSVLVSDGYIRETIPGTVISSAYMTLKNTTGEALTLSHITSSVSKRIEIHEHTMDEGMMKMRQRENLVIPANSSVTLQPGGLHLMVFELEQSLTAGHTVSLTLHFSEGESLAINVPVNSLKKSGTQKHMHHH